MSETKHTAIDAEIISMAFVLMTYMTDVESFSYAVERI